MIYRAAILLTALAMVPAIAIVGLWTWPVGIAAILVMAYAGTRGWRRRAGMTMKETKQ